MFIDVHLNWAGMFTCEPDWAWNTETTPLTDYDLWAVYEGRGTMHTPEGSLRLRPGDCLVLRPRGSHSCRTTGDAPLIVHVAHFDFVTREGTLTAPPAERVPPLHRPLLDLTLFRGLTTRIARSHMAGRSREADTWLRAALLELERQDRDRAADGVGETARRVERICAQIMERPERPWRVGELAASCSLSPDHFTRVFKAARDVPPREFILRSRLAAARQLLLSSSYGIGRIAELAGFTDIYHFSRVFKLRTGVSPSKFRAQGSERAWNTWR